jgi:hypothetical protein
LRAALEEAGRDQQISPFQACVHGGGRSMMWRAPNSTAGLPRCTTTQGTDASGIHGTPGGCASGWRPGRDGCQPSPLNPVSRYAEQLEALAAVVGLSWE